MQHVSHIDIANRLKRTEGHVRKIIEMIESGRSCVDLAQQLHAVERAVHAAKTALIHDHIDHCLADAAEDPARRTAQIEEFRQITRYL
ncbi:MAG: metal-sensing transcriptional repressor [Pseudomonadota bacterium]